MPRFDWTLPAEQWSEAQSRQWIYNQRRQEVKGLLSDEQVQALRRLGIQPITPGQRRRFSEAEVAQIVARIDAGEAATAVARSLGASASSVRAAHRRATGRPIAKAGPPRRLSDKESRQIVARIDAGEAAATIAGDLGVNTATVYRSYRRTAGRPHPATRRRTQPQEIAEIIRRVDSGESVASVASHVGCSPSSVILLYRQNTGHDLPTPQRRRVLPEVRSEVVARLQAGEAKESVAAGVQLSVRSVVRIYEQETGGRLAKRSHRQYTDAERSQIVARIDAGESVVAVGESMGCSGPAIANIYRATTGRGLQQRLDAQQRAQIVELMQAGAPRAEIARYFGCGVRLLYTIYKRTEQLGDVPQQPRSPAVQQILDSFAAKPPSPAQLARELIEANQLSIQQIADKAGVSYATVVRLRREMGISVRRSHRVL